jgi:hypothetical protein
MLNNTDKKLFIVAQWFCVSSKSIFLWLADTLKQAGDNFKSVHILSQIPTGTGESPSVWDREYSRIIER